MNRKPTQYLEHIDFVPPLPLSDDDETNDPSFVPPLPSDDEPSDDLKSCSELEERGRKKKSRWGDETKKLNIPTVQAMIPATFNTSNLEEPLLRARLEQIDHKLRTGDVIPPERERSVSPLPTYDSQGRRTNVREARYRKKLEEERTIIIEELLKKNPLYKPPSDYNQRKQSQNNMKFVHKLRIPQDERPEINFMGLLIGPRGHELKKMERESGAKISIRGKGSMKEGKCRQDPTINQGADEPLHALIMADAPERLQAGINAVQSLIDIAISTPDGENTIKQRQLKELAILNGTWNPEEQDICTNCGAVGHRKYDCTQALNVTISLICKICGGVGHIASDCINKNNPEMLKSSQQRQERLQHEYANLMAEIHGKSIGMM